MIAKYLNFIIWTLLEQCHGLLGLLVVRDCVFCDCLYHMCYTGRNVNVSLRGRHWMNVTFTHNTHTPRSNSALTRNILHRLIYFEKQFNGVRAFFQLIGNSVTKLSLPCGLFKRRKWCFSVFESNFVISPYRYNSGVQYSRSRKILKKFWATAPLSLNSQWNSTLDMTSKMLNGTTRHV